MAAVTEGRNRAPARRKPPAYRRPEQRPEKHLLRANTEQAAERAGRRGTATGPAPLAQAGRPPERGSQRGTGRDPCPQRRDLTGTLPGPGHRLAGRQRSRPGNRTHARRPRTPVTSQRPRPCRR